MTPRMTTEERIARLAALPAPPRLRPYRIAISVLALVGAGLALLLPMMGLRPDLAQALAAPVTMAKTAIPLSLAALALPAAMVTARPDASAPPLWLLAVPGGIALLLFGATLVATPAALIPAGVMGQTAGACLMAVGGLSLIPVIVGTRLMRRGATTRPGLTGALIGLASGGAAAAGYALHCTEDNPLFYVTWYGAGIAIATLIGAVLGRRWLRW